MRSGEVVLLVDMIAAKRRQCSPVFTERNLRTKLLRRFQTAWLAWKASANCPAGEASWESREFLATIAHDGSLELVEKTRGQRERNLRPYEVQPTHADETRRHRPAIPPRSAMHECWARSLYSTENR